MGALLAALEPLFTAEPLKPPLALAVYAPLKGGQRAPLQDIGAIVAAIA